MQPALARLLQNGKGSKAGLAAKYKELHCDESFPMIRHLFDTVSYGSEVWGTSCTGRLFRDLKSTADLQLSGIEAQAEHFCTSDFC